jgi:hypothetical protein
MQEDYLIRAAGKGRSRKAVMHGNRVLQYFVSDFHLFERMNSPRRDHEINRASADNLPSRGLSPRS